MSVGFNFIGLNAIAKMYNINLYFFSVIDPFLIETFGITFRI